jgi:hypothetical protein
MGILGAGGGDATKQLGRGVKDDQAVEAEVIDETESQNG